MTVCCDKALNNTSWRFSEEGAPSPQHLIRARCSPLLQNINGRQIELCGCLLWRSNNTPETTTAVDLEAGAIKRALLAVISLLALIACAQAVDDIGLMHP